ncbi:hypothetical protein LTR46_011987 [Exophiala xenobiotica]|nr:hypothetical protein LTR61_011987 [Exophiala xenobiotica]KAK5548023.1 hypothetical protein LTR46_011987 [Exophiala xenobiotica]
MAGKLYHFQKPQVFAGPFWLRYVATRLITLGAIFIGLFANDSARKSLRSGILHQHRIADWLLATPREHTTLWAVPEGSGKAQQAMENQLYRKLGLGPGSRVLDAGARSDYVAMHMAEKGLTI